MRKKPKTKRSKPQSAGQVDTLAILARHYEREKFEMEQREKLEMEQLQLEREGMDQMLGLYKDLKSVCKVLSALEVSCKGDPTILGDRPWVNFEVARLYVGAKSRRTLEKAVDRGALSTQGKGQNRRVSVQSLLKYLPPTKTTN